MVVMLMCVIRCVYYSVHGDPDEDDGDDDHRLFLS